MQTLENLEKTLFAAKAVSIRDIKSTLYKGYNFPGVYAIFNGKNLIKIGKTSGKPTEVRKEKQLADRIWGLTLSDSVLRQEMNWTLEQAENCTVRCVQVDDELERGRLEYYFMAKYQPCVNQRELKR